MEQDRKIDIFSSLYKVLTGLTKTWIICLILCLLCPILKIGNLWWHYTPIYSSKVTFSVIKDYNGTSSFRYNKTATDKLAASFLTIMNSDLMVNSLCQDLNVTTLPATFWVERIESTNLFSVYARSQNPQNAKKTLDALLRNYSQISKVALNDATLTVIEEPVLATQPSNQIQYFKEIIKGICLGLMIYCLILILYVLIRRTFSKDYDIVKYLHCPCLAKIGVLKEMKNRQPLLIHKDLKASHQLREVFRKIRLQVESDHQKYQHQIYMLTSTLAHEGKSMVAANLSLSLAHKDYHVLLIDFDLRNPSQYRNFSLENRVAQDYIQDIFSFYNGVEYENLDLMCLCEGVTQASEILSDSKISSLLQEMREKYDFIIIDTPPIHLLADASIVAQYVDASLFVVKEDYATIDEGQEAMESLKNANVEVLGCLFNQVRDVPLFSSHYGYGYGYGYYNNYYSRERYKS